MGSAFDDEKEVPAQRQVDARRYY